MKFQLSNVVALRTHCDQKKNLTIALLPFLTPYICVHNILREVIWRIGGHHCDSVLGGNLRYEEEWAIQALHNKKQSV